MGNRRIQDHMAERAVWWLRLRTATLPTGTLFRQRRSQGLSRGSSRVPENLLLLLRRRISLLQYILSGVIMGKALEVFNREFFCGRTRLII